MKSETIIDAALNDPSGSGKAYFHLGDHYVAYNWSADRVDDGVVPASKWGFPAYFFPQRLDSALAGQTAAFRQYGYFFVGRQYMRYDFSKQALDPSVPTTIGDGWQLPAPFSERVDASFNGKFSRLGKAYFFRDDQYLRVDWSNGVDPGYPRSIGSLPGMPPGFASSIDAAVDGDGPFANYGYLFKGRQYIRMDWDASGSNPHIDGPPQSIQDKWPGLLELLFAGTAKEQALVWLHWTTQKLFQYIASIAFGAQYADDVSLLERALATHFHIDDAMSTRDKLIVLDQIWKTYTQVMDALGHSDTNIHFTTDTTPGDVAYTTYSSSATPPNPASGSAVNVAVKFGTKGPMERAAVMIHEHVHFVLGRLWDPATSTWADVVDIPEWYVTDPVASALGLPTAPPDPKIPIQYDLMTLSQSVLNPSSYAAFAQHIYYTQDTRFGEGRPDK